jgi:hypothetical protein
MLPVAGCIPKSRYTLPRMKINIGTVWFAAWLFTIGYLHLTFWKGVLAIVRAEDAVG